ncbi:hypothetical protein ACIBJC_22740 [Streptomyces sp. NPDC050509]|uniref:hypothetical protein n=1 Tax=Streptomyces sp. NPDC050509 TaxID=3365620 RepID=UPI0037A22841
MNDANTPERDGKQVQKGTENASSQILDMMDLKGKVTESGALILRCSDYSPEDEVYRARHPWSLRNIPIEEMKNAMDRLREELSKNGWNIVKDGPDDTVGKAPQIVANSKNGEFSADIRLLDNRKYGDDPSLIEVTVVSKCYKSSPEASPTP